MTCKSRAERVWGSFEVLKKPKNDSSFWNVVRSSTASICFFRVENFKFSFVQTASKFYSVRNEPSALRRSLLEGGAKCFFAKEENLVLACAPQLHF